MVWIFATLLILLGALVPAFRRFVPYCLAGLIVLYLVLAFFGGTRTKSPNSADSEVRPTAERILANTPQKNPAPGKEVLAAQIQVEEVTTNASVVNNSGRVSQVTVRIHNASPDALDSIDFRLSIQDCRNPAPRARRSATDCTRVHEQTGTVAVTVPSQQSGDAQIMLHAPPWDEVHLLGTAQVNVEIIGAHAKAD